MKHSMLINAVHKEQKRMATVNREDGKLVEYNIQMTVKEPLIGNIYKGVVLKVEKGLQAAFICFSGKRSGFLPLKDVSPAICTESGNSKRPTLKGGQELLVQVVREMSEKKGALLTGYISLPGRYMVLLPERESDGVSRKIEDEEDRRRLKDLISQIKMESGMGMIIRTAGMSRTKQELTRDYQHLIRLWREIQKKAETTAAPSLIYQESDFGVQSLRDYLTSEIEEILVDEPETYRKMKSYCKIVSPRNLKMIKLYKEKLPIFDRYNLEEQIREIYQERVELKSGGSIVLKPTEALITIDVNSGRGSHMRNVEETAFRANTEAAEEIARQLRLRDLGGLIVIDFIDMMDKKHIMEVEKTFKKAMSIDRARIQLSRISKFGLLELSRQKKHSTIQEISYIKCPHCEGTGLRPSLEYTALNAYRRIELEVVKGAYSLCKITLPQEVADYLLNNKRGELVKLETAHETKIHINGAANVVWDKITIEKTVRPVIEALPKEVEPASAAPEEEQALANGLPEEEQEEATVDKSSANEEAPAAAPAAAPKKKRRRPRHKKKAPAGVTPVGDAAVSGEQEEPLQDQSALAEGDLPGEEQAVPLVEAAEETITPETAEPKKRPRRRIRSRRRKTATAADAPPRESAPVDAADPAAGGAGGEATNAGDGELSATIVAVGEPRKKTYRRPRTRRTKPENPSPEAPAPVDSGSEQGGENN